MWVLFVYIGLVPGVWLLVALIPVLRDLAWKIKFRWRQQSHQMATGWRAGRCMRCGYDIRANESRCSECGEPIMTLRPPPSKLL
jgi:hypothetical protein